MQVIFYVKLPASLKKKSGQYVSCCPVLDVYSQGETEQKALSNLKEALKLFFLSCFERGTLDEVMKTCGFTPIEKKAVKEQPFPKKYRAIEIPLPFKTPSRAADSAECHV